LLKVAVVPALNEELHIAACLEALDGQVGAQFDHIVLLANNCTDATAGVARMMKTRSGTELHVVEEVLAPHAANAGMARRRAMDVALLLAGPDGVLLTTDADGQVDPDWLANNLAALARGAEVVAGWVELHPVDWGKIPLALHEDDAREQAYDALCDAIHARLDPDVDDPAPRHTQHSGASIALTVAAYRRCGGIPLVASGEDRAVIAALRLVDAKIRHDPGVRVVVSGRIDGRAVGGMAETIRRRMVQPDAMLDDRLEPAAICALRAQCRAAARYAYETPSVDPSALSSWLDLPIGAVVGALRQPYFGQAWARLERQSPALRRVPVSVADLPAQMAAAEAILAGLRDASEAAGSGGVMPPGDAVVVP
jgi:hypothetical protein